MTPKTRKPMFTRALGAAVLFAAGCGGLDSYDTAIAPEFSGQWLQLDRYIASYCFVLEEETGTVTIFKDGEQDIEEKPWVWEQPEPNLYVIDNKSLAVYTSVEEDCFDLEYQGLTALACPCALPLP